MGALTSNRKRGDEFLSLNNRQLKVDDSLNYHASKRPRLLSSFPSSFSSILQSPERAVSSKSAVSRISRYPEATPKWRREVHAPVRTLRFGFSFVQDSREPVRGLFGKEKHIGDFMGNVLVSNYNEAKNIALRSLRYVKKEKEVVTLLDEEPEKVVVSVDSSTEEIDDVEDGREKSVLSGSRSKDENGAIVTGQESMVSELSNGNARVENTEKMLDALSLDDDGVEVLSKSAYKKLLADARKRDAKIGILDFEIKLERERLSFLQELHPARKPEEQVPHEPFIPLTAEEEEEVQRAFRGNRRKVLVAHENSNIEITGEVLQCLRSGAWLNDEVINLYLELLKEREKREPEKFLKCHFFNTFFYKKLAGRGGYDYKSVRRWTTQRKLGYSLTDCDKIFVPIHKEIHWCLAIINRRDQKFQYLDSLGGKDFQVLRLLAKYLMDEVKDKTGRDIDVSSWDQEFVEGLPEQENGFDCGMFMIKYADFYSRGLGLCFSQENMPYFRLRTAKEILRLRAD